MRLKMYSLRFLGWLLLVIKLVPSSSDSPPQRRSINTVVVILQQLANQTKISRTAPRCHIFRSSEVQSNGKQEGCLWPLSLSIRSPPPPSRRETQPAKVKAGWEERAMAHSLGEGTSGSGRSCSLGESLAALRAVSLRDLPTGGYLNGGGPRCAGRRLR